MAENFTNYTEVDPNTRITITATRVAWANLDRNETAYVYRDKGVDFFDGDFTQLLTVYMATLVNGSYVNAWGLTNTLDSFRAIDTANGDYLGVALLGLTAEVVPTIALYECDGGGAYSDTYEASLATAYYLKIVRDESVGAYGTLYCYIYSDAARATLLDTLTLTLHTSTKDFRYIHAVNSDNSTATPYPSSGYSENLIIDIPAVTTQAVTDIVSTTATGNGTLNDLGTPTATQHGHCWSTSSLPAIADSKTTNGVPAAIGAFTSALTSLTPATLYYVRAYATNDNGTVYGGEVNFTAGAPSSGELTGLYAVVETRFHYADAYGVERYVEGTAVP